LAHPVSEVAANAAISTAAPILKARFTMFILSFSFALDVHSSRLFSAKALLRIYASTPKSTRCNSRRES
jgi:hypothetical protein